MAANGRPTSVRGWGLLATPVLDRSRLSERPRPGPMIIEEYEGTVVVPPDCTARLDRSAIS